MSKQANTSCASVLIALVIVMFFQYAHAGHCSSYDYEPLLPKEDPTIVAVSIGIMLTGLIVSRLIEMPRKHEIDVRKLSPEHTRSSLERFVDPCLIERRKPRGTVYGLIRTVNQDYLLFDTEADSLIITFDQVKKVKDLYVEAARKKVDRTRSGIVYYSCAVAELVALTDDHGPFAGGTRALGWTTATLFAALGTYSFARKPRVEKEAANWKDLLSPDLSLGLRMGGGVLASRVDRKIHDSHYTLEMSLHWRF